MNTPPMMQSGRKAVSLPQIVFPLAAAACLLPSVSAGMALMLGMVLALSLHNPYLSFTKKLTHRLLQASVIGLGAAMNLKVIGMAGLHGVGYTAVGITLTVIVGLFLGKLFKTDSNTSLLVTVGTAICGGSAIAAVASTIRARSHEVSVALATVFFLNAVALFIFPGIGHYFQLGQTEFGLWSALAIHDTSSVVGAAQQYGAQALEIATPVKLARALWIIPVSFVLGSVWNRKKAEGAGKAKKPWFILGFLAAAALVTWFPELQGVGRCVSEIAKRTLVLTLFLIGSGLTRETIRQVGIKPCLQGATLWFMTGGVTLASILMGWVRV